MIELVTRFLASYHLPFPLESFLLWLQRLAVFVCHHQVLELLRHRQQLGLFLVRQIAKVLKAITFNAKIAVVISVDRPPVERRYPCCVLLFHAVLP